MKRVLSLVLIVILMLSTSKNVFAVSYGESENEGDKYLSESALTNLWVEGRQNFELIESKDDKYFTSRFSVGSKIYQTWYYSDQNRTNQIGYTTHLDG